MTQASYDGMLTGVTKDMTIASVWLIRLLAGRGIIRGKLRGNSSRGPLQ